MIEQKVKALREAGYDDPAVLVIGSWAVTSALWERRPPFIPLPGGRSASGEIGMLAGARVYNLSRRNVDPVVIVGDLGKLGVPRFFRARADEPGEMLLDILRFDVRAIDEAEASELVANHPEIYRRALSGEDLLPADEAIRDLLSRVRFELDVSAEFEIKDPKAA